jgi:hypothetical protein
MSPYYYHVALHRIPKDDYFNEQTSHDTIKKLIDIFVKEYKRMNKLYYTIARVLHMIRVCIGDYKLRYRRKFNYNRII